MTSRRSFDLVAATGFVALTLVGCGKSSGDAPATGVLPAVVIPTSTPGVVREALSAPPNAQFVVLAERSFSLEQNATVHGGSVGARAMSTTGALVSGTTGAAFQNAFDVTQTMFAEYLTIEQNAAVGPVSTDHLISQLNASHGPVSPFVTPPALPGLQPVTAGTTALTVPANGTVTKAAGSYGAVTVSANATLNLSGGVYQIASLTVQANSQVHVLASTQIRITGRMSVAENAFVGPTTAGLTAGALRIEISGTNGGTNTATSTPHAFDIIQNSTVRGLLLAPNGSIYIEQNGTVHGAVAAKDVDVAQNGIINWEDGLGPLTCSGSCDDNNACTTDACSNGTCTHTPVAAGTVCRASAGVCDAAETCDGTVAQCPSDAKLAAGTTCRASAGSCDVAEVCNGVAVTCPSDTLASSGTVCRVSAGACDVAETCSGASAQCPSDAFAPATTVCRASAGACDLAEQCSGAAAACPADGFASAGTSCRAAAGACDAAEVCSGSASACPTDAKIAAGTICRASTGVCDVGESCDGATNACPNDVLVSAGTTCRASAGPCDVSEACTGASGACPADVLASSGTTCRAAAGVCDALEVCSGSSSACPTDTKVAAGTVCRAASGVCDAAETCNGATNTCPADAFVSAGTVCRAAIAGGCDVSEACTGASGACPADGFASAGTVCRAAGGVCDAVESCSGASNACPADAKVAAGTVCRASAGVCDAVESCDGAANACPSDAFASAGTVCRAAVAGGCDVGESCSGSSAACPADVVAGAGTVCRTAAGPCDASESCSGGSNACPADAKLPATTVCRAAAGPCDAAELCSGSADACPNDVFLPPSTVCRAATGACDAAESCSGAAAACPADATQPNGTTCSDGNACTQSDTCQSGTCTGANPVVCAASDACHVAGACNPANGQCSNPMAANGTTCSDGNACTQTDTCQNGTCSGANPVTCAAADQCHSAGTCNTATGTCSNPTKANGTACSDGNACTQTDTCQAGACTGANPVTCAASDQCHTAGTCDTATGTCSSPAKADGAACSDGNACTQSDTCQSGTCTGASPVTCAASDACHVAGTCNPANGQCSNPIAANGTTCSDGNACTRTDTCQGGACTGANPVTCAAADQCHTAGTCDTATGTCSSPAKADGAACSDGNACTQSDTCQSGTCTGASPVACAASDACHVAGTCNPANGQCSNPIAANGTTCSDGNACTQTDTCQSGTCTGANPVACAAADQCHSAGTCDTATGTCSNPTKANGTACSDGNACTQTDTCQAGACTGANPVTCAAADQCHTAGTCDTATGTCSSPEKSDGAACSDGNACTQSDTCQSGTCTGASPVTCAASDACHVAGTCNPASGQCSNPNAANGTACSDGNACTQTDTCQAGACTGANPVTCAAADQCHTAGTCDTATGTCSSPEKSDGAACSDGNACTQSDTCQSGTCTGASPVTCAASDACHVAGTCNPASGLCSNPSAANGTSCSDGNICNGAETCNATGACQAGAPPSFDDGNPCTTDACTPALGITHTPVPAGASCTDGNVCNGLELCDAAGACQAGTPLSLSDGNPCTLDTCDPITGAHHTPAGAGSSCSDGNACNGQETCNAAGACVAGTPPTCTTSNPCRTASCDPSSGCQALPKFDGAFCDDQNPCTTSDRCEQGNCTGATVTCTAADSCHDDGACDTATGVCSSPVKASCQNAAPDPCLGAAPLNPAVASTLVQQLSQRWSGPAPVQTGFSATVLDATHVTSLHGQIWAEDGQPLSGVSVTIVGHPEFGATLSRANGQYDLVVNGGALLTADFRKSGVIPIRRDFMTGWGEFINVDDVTLVMRDPAITTLSFGSGVSCQVARGSIETDVDGSRRGTLIVNPSTSATQRAHNGVETPVTTASVRLTELTVGPAGDTRMPATLPVESAYGYAVQLSSDEADTAAADTVELDHPAAFYVENILGLRVGTGVAAGVYERCPTCEGEHKGWTATGNARVVKVVSDGAGGLTLDSTGVGAPDTQTDLDAIGVTPCELQQIAALYPAGAVLVRARLPRLGAWSLSPGFAHAPYDDVVHTKWPDADLPTGCVEDHGRVGIDTINRRVITRDPIVGTPFTLVCSSARSQESETSRKITLWDDRPTGNLKKIDVYTTVGGTTTVQSLPPAPYQTATVTWNGIDSCGRPLYGTQNIVVRVKYTYDAEYGEVPRFALADSQPTGTPTRLGRVEWRNETFPAERPIQPTAPSCDLDVHHVFDARGMLQKGDGTTVLGRTAGPVIERVAGPGPHDPYNHTDPGCDIPVATLDFAQYPVRAVAVGPDGSVYFSLDGGSVFARIYRVKADGIARCVAGSGGPGYNGDDIPATSAKIDPYIGQLVPSPACDGCLYFADSNNNRVRYVDGSGVIRAVAGNGVVADICYNLNATGEGGPAVLAHVYAPLGLALGLDGSVFFSNSFGYVGRVLPDGTVHRVASDYHCFGAQGGEAPIPVRGLDEFMTLPSRLALDPQGRLVPMDTLGILGTTGGVAVSGGVVTRLNVDGLMYPVIGGGTVPVQDGTPAAKAAIAPAWAVAVGRDGTIQFSQTVHDPLFGYFDGFGGQILAIDATGIARRLLGGDKPSTTISQPGDPAATEGIVGGGALDFALSPDGAIVFVEGGGAISRIRAPLRNDGPGPFLIGAPDGREVYEFNGAGRHLGTRDALTHSPRYTFGYDAKGRLDSITDGAGLATTIERDAQEHLRAIVSPFGQRTTIGTNPDGYVVSVTNPASESTTLEYGQLAGLVTKRTESDGSASTFTYGPDDRLVAFADPRGGGLTLSGAFEQGIETSSITTKAGLTIDRAVTYAAFDRYRREDVAPDGTKSVQEKGAGGLLTTTFASGLTSSLDLRGDSRFGMSAPVPRLTTLTDATGSTFSQFQEHTVTLQDPLNPYSVVSISDNYRIGGLLVTSYYDGPTRTFQRDNSGTITLDDHGRLASVTTLANAFPPVSPTTFAYDSLGHVQSITQGTHARTFTYGALGQLATDTDPAGAVTSYTYDGAGRVATQTLPDGSTLSFTVDTRGRITHVTLPAEPASAFTYLTTNLLASATLDGVSSTYGYDLDSRVVSAALPLGAVNLSYDAVGHLAKAVLPSGTATLTTLSPTSTSTTSPDGQSLGVVTNGLFPTSQTWAGAVNGSVVLARATGTKITTETVAGDSIALGYSGGGKIAKAGDMFFFSTSGNELQRTTLRTLQDTPDFDSYGLLKGRNLEGPGLSLTWSDTRDEKGRLTQRTDTLQGTPHASAYHYDVRGRVDSFTRDGIPTLFGYDGAGNRTSSVTAGISTIATYDANGRLAMQGLVSYAYDAAGNLATKTEVGAQTQYTYDVFNRLTRVDLPDGRRIDYVLDPLGRRIGKKLNGALVAGWLYRDSHRIAAELDAAGNLAVRYVYPDGEALTPSFDDSLRERMGLVAERIPAGGNLAPAYIVKAGRVLFVATDDVGTPRLYADADSGVVAYAADRDPWGRVLVETGTPPASIGLSGGLYDADTGLVLLGGRSYDPATGRFTSPAPLRSPKTWSSYQVAGGDPINRSALVPGVREISDGGERHATAPFVKQKLDSLCSPNGMGGVTCDVGGLGSDSSGGLDPNLPVMPINDRGEQDIPLASGSSAIDLNGGPAISNAAPVITLFGTQTFAQPATGVYMDAFGAQNKTAFVTDDGAVAPLVTAWKVVSDPNHPAGQPPTFPPAQPSEHFHDPSDPGTLVDFFQVGDYVLELSAFDGEYTTTAQTHVTVVGPQNGPGSPWAPGDGFAVSITGPTQAEAQSTIQLVGATVDASGQPVPGATFEWSVLTAPGFGPGLPAPNPPVYYVPTGSVTDVQFQNEPGPFVFQLAVTASGVVHYQTWTVQVTVTNHAPVAQAGADQTLSSGATNLLGSVTDDGFPAPAKLTTSWSQLAGPGNAAIATPTSLYTNVSLPLPGAYTFRLTGYDGALAGTSDVHVTLTAPAGGTPVVSLAGITDDALVTKPVTVTGTVSEGAWALQYRLGGRDDVDTAWTNLATGTGAKSGTLAKFDPTLLENGIYTVRLLASTSAGESTTDVSVAVDGNMKIGLFSLSYVDMEVQLGRLPIQIIRNYDNRRGGRAGDFGADWELSTRGVRVEKAGKIGVAWVQTLDTSGFFPQYCLKPGHSSRVTVTLPGGKQYRFHPDGGCQSTNAIRTPSITWINESQPGNPTVKLTAEGDDAEIAFGPAPGPTMLQSANGDPWDPHLFNLTTEDGSVLAIEQGVGLTSITELTGDSITVTADGFVHSTGVSVPFTRDAQGRITKITDPGGASLSYAYDASGDLISVTERTGATTTYTYDKKHNITAIVDQRGIKAARVDYDADGRMISSTDADGKVVTLNHNLDAQTEIVTDRLGKQTVYLYDDRGNVTKTVDARGGVTLSSYDTFDNELTKTDALGRTTTFEYNALFQQTSVTDPLGHTTTRTYTDFGQVRVMTDPLGHVTTTEYDGITLVPVNMIDPLGHITSNEYDNLGNRIKVTDPLGRATLYHPNGFNQISRTLSPLGHTVSYGFDANGRETTRVEQASAPAFGQNQGPDIFLSANFTSPMVIDLSGSAHDNDGLPAGNTFPYLFEATGPGPVTLSQASGNYAPFSVTTVATFTTPGTYLLRFTVSDTQISGFTELPLTVPGTGTYLAYPMPPKPGPDMLGTLTVYDANGRVVKVTNADGGVSSTTYDDAGHVLTRTDPLGRVTSMVYDDLGRNIKTTYPDGTFRAQSYDAEGRTVTRTDEGGKTTTMLYDAVGNNVKTLFADGSFTTTTYDLARQVVATTDERGNTTTFGYDGAGRRTTVTNALSQTSTTTYDAAGRATSSTDALGHTTTTTYDAAGRVTSTTLADGTSTTYAYDAAGQKLSETDALGRMSEWVYDPDGRLAESHDQSGAAWLFGYDGRGNMLTQTDALGRTTRYVFDEMSRQVKRTLPLGMSETMQYDIAGEKISKVDFNGYTTTYGYDTRGRLVAKAPDPARGEASVSMTYTPTGRKAQTANGAGVVRYTYDVRERLAKKEMPAGALTYTYDPHGNVATMKSSNVGGVNVAYGWDAANRLASVTDPAGASTMEYDAAGRLTKRTDPNDVVMTYAYDNVNRVLDVAANRGVTPIANYAYTRDTIGRVTTLAELGGRTVTYGYSQAGRLVNETVTGEPHGVNGSIAYTHDSVGNRLTRTSSVGPVAGQAFAYDANDRITTETYDLNGNTLAAEGDAFGYDFEDRLVSINGAVGLSYDGQGNLASRTEGGSKTSYLVDEIGPSGWSQIVEEVGSGAVLKTFTYGRLPLRTNTGGSPKGYTTDGHADVRALTDASGSVTDEFDYEAFGTSTRTLGATSNAVRYAAERAESGALTFLRGRHMRNTTGRFVEMDPVGGSIQSPSGLHRQLYAGGEPVGNRDPSGYFSEGGVIGISAGIAVGGILAMIQLDHMFRPVTSSGGTPGGWQGYLAVRPLDSPWAQFIAGHMYITTRKRDMSSPFQAPLSNRVYEAFAEGGLGKFGKLFMYDHDFGAPVLAGKPAFEKENDERSPIINLTDNSDACLKAAMVVWNSMPQDYAMWGIDGPNSNTAAVWMLQTCGLVAEVPGDFVLTPGAASSTAVLKSGTSG